MQHRALWGAEHSERAVESRDLLVSNATLLDGGLRAAFWCDNRPPLVTPSCRPVRAIEVGTTSCTIGSISSRDLEDAGMSPKKTGNDTTAGDRVVEMARRQSAEREKGYRAQALKLYPHILAAKIFGSSRFIIRTTTMTIIRQTAVIGSCFVFIAMIMSMRDIRLLRAAMQLRQANGGSRYLPIRHSLPFGLY
jgi:hypothetical protein